RLPWGAGRATLRAGLRIALGQTPSGVHSAGNGAAMRAAVIGVYYRDQPDLRRSFGRALAEVTHLDSRAVEGALYVAELAAAASMAAPAASRPALVDAALPVAAEPSLRAALLRARDLAAQAVPLDEAARALGTTGFVVHTVGFATRCFLHRGDDPLASIRVA